MKRQHLRMKHIIYIDILKGRFVHFKLRIFSVFKSKGAGKQGISLSFDVFLMQEEKNAVQITKKIMYRL